MEIIEKKISTTIIIVSLLLIIYSLLAKDFDPYFDQQIYNLVENNFEIPLSYYFVNIFGIDMPYRGTLLLLIIFLGMGIYLFIYKSDAEIKVLYSNFRRKIESLYFSMGDKLKSYVNSLKRTEKNPIQLATQNLDRASNINTKTNKFKIIDSIYIVAFIALSISSYFKHSDILMIQKSVSSYYELVVFDKVIEQKEALNTSEGFLMEAVVMSKALGSNSTSTILITSIILILIILIEQINRKKFYRNSFLLNTSVIIIIWLIITGVFIGHVNNKGDEAISVINSSVENTQ
ncbi:hypothetical protein [Arenibacter sp. ARW7G5Y1]|uniref:hypothetical protein n=1 Tax=Arenibacter sp. ARW7G5Y1 TaxID=2135619 RepID=UPI000D76E009|nr:hypothetical protein [Arenibacter sp. ARW7G5Y1]PXX22833.1 hypothetical protein C7972_12212 [Arenibacter sp. ARW7G5Y1]